jgi:choline-sulfatase
LDSLAQESTIYDSCYATGPYTTESFPGILAGQHSFNGAQYGETVAYKALPPDSPSLATELSDAGYNTGAVISNPHLVETRNFHIGFDIFENHRSQSRGDHDSNDSKLNFGSYMYNLREQMRKRRTKINPLALLYAAYRYSQLKTDWPTTDGAEIASQAKDVISEFSEDDDPFFLWTHFMDVHAPINPVRANKAGLGSIPQIRSLLWDASRAGRLYESNYEFLYDAALRYVDRQISKIVDKLREEGILNDSIIIVTGDHGEVLFDRQEVYGHPPHYHYDELLHVPLLVFGEKSQAERNQAPFSLAWLYELVGDTIDVTMEGFPPTVNGNINTTHVISDTLDQTGHTVTVRNDAKKVITHNRAGTETIQWEYSEASQGFLYQVDKSERQPLPEVPTHLMHEAEAHLTSPSALPEVEGSFSEATMERLQDLGYKM